MEEQQMVKLHKQTGVMKREKEQWRLLKKRRSIMTHYSEPTAMKKGKNRRRVSCIYYSYYSAYSAYYICVYVVCLYMHVHTHTGCGKWHRNSYVTIVHTCVRYIH
mmetsp:Transcript_22867/g.40484  ORF Transcript_22867/g.40484 Transcript_22867/m.40484 type:complete len:105 (+) Transcript_22867:393-707(+)